MSGPAITSGTPGIAQIPLDNRTQGLTLEDVASGQAVVGPTESDGTNTELEAQIQQWLIANGFEPIGGADGWYGPKTAEAVAAFQAAHGLEATGVVDAQTLAALQQGAQGTGVAQGAAQGAAANNPGGTEADAPDSSSESGTSTPEQENVANAAQTVSDLQTTATSNPSLAESLEEPIGQAQAQLTESAETLLVTTIQADGTSATSYSDWVGQVDAATVEALAMYPNDPVAQSAILERAAYMKSPAYLEEQRDVAQADLDVAEEAAEADGTVTQDERAELAELEAEVARLDALLEGARAAEAPAPGTPVATDAAVQVAVEDDYTTTSPNAADAHDAKVNQRTDAAVLAEYNALVASGVEPEVARETITERYSGAERDVVEASFNRL